MTLTIHTEEDSQRQLKVTVEVAEERVQGQMRKTARGLARQMHIPGFRKGKVPFNVLISRIGPEVLRAEAIEDMLENVLAEALEEVDAEAYRQPSLDDMETEPLTLKLTIPLEPTATLPDFRAVRRELDEVTITDEAMADALEHLRSHHQVLEDIDRPLEKGDMATLQGQGYLIDDEEEKLFWSEENIQLLMDSEKTFKDLPFVDNLLGASTGDDVEFSFDFPEDYDDEDLAGKKARFELQVLNVQSRFLPELDDELASKEGEYESLDELREALHEQLLNQAQDEARSELLDSFVDEVMEGSELAFPPAAVESELDSTVESLKQQVTNTGWEWDDYLTMQGKDESSLRDEMRESVTERVKRGIILRQIIEEERLEIKSADYDAALEDRLSRFDDEAVREQVRNIYLQGQAMESLANEIMVDKIYQRIKDIVSGNAPDLDALQAEEEAAAAAAEAAAAEAADAAQAAALAAEAADEEE